jgi:PAS domain-containing protein
MQKGSRLFLPPAEIRQKYRSAAPRPNRKLLMQINDCESQRHASWAAIEASCQAMLDVIPAAVCTCDAQGLITYFNPFAKALWGRAPKLRDMVDRFCGSYQMYLSDGTPIRHEECWMARALLEGRAYVGRKIFVERYDGTRVFGEAYAYPLHNEQAQLVGAVNLVADITVLRDQGANGAAPHATLVSRDAALAMIEVAASILTAIKWEPSVFN